MKFVMLSDLHLTVENPVARQDDLTLTQWTKLAFVFDYAKKIGAKILQAGDICDKPRSWILLPQLILFLKKYDLGVYCVMGQHDTYMYSEETRDRTNLGILAKAGLVHLLRNDEPTILGGGTIQIYGANFGHKLGQVRFKGLTLGVIHASISDKSAYPGHIFSKPSDFLTENEGYDVILCGDIHRSFYFERNGQQILNVGPLTRQEATDYNFEHKPGFAVFDTEDRSIEWVDIPCEPAEKVLSWDHIERKKENEEMLDEFVGGLNGSDGDVESVSLIENLIAFIHDNKIDDSVVNELAEVIDDIQMIVGRE